MSTKPVSITMTENQWLRIHRTISQSHDPTPTAVALMYRIEEAIGIATARDDADGTFDR